MRTSSSALSLWPRCSSRPCGLAGSIQVRDALHELAIEELPFPPTPGQAGGPASGHRLKMPD
jgi:hypothetical protein